MNDLELLHHFTTQTCKTLSNRPEIGELWQVEVIRIALQYGFLMRAILALSALHLAHLKPDASERYLLKASSQQNIAITIFSPIMSDVTQSNRDAYFAFSSLVFTYGFASSGASEYLALSGDSSAGGTKGWLHLIRGIPSILTPVLSSIKTGRLGLLCVAPYNCFHEPLIDTSRSEDDYRLVALSNLTTMESPDENARVYASIISELRNIFALLSTPNTGFCEHGLTFMWPAMLPQRYIMLLGQRNPEALVILAHWCVLLKRLERCWWIKDQGERLVSTVHDMLDEKWRRWIEWPMQQVGLVLGRYG
jgi:hypothetical protein